MLALALLAGVLASFVGKGSGLPSRSVYTRLDKLPYVKELFETYISPHLPPLLLQGSTSPTSVAPTEPYEIPDLLHASVDDLAQGLESGAFSSVQLTRAYLARIAEVNDKLRAVIETNPYALQEAERADAARREGKATAAGSSGPLFGIPILIKDNLATARPDQTYMNTTAGSFALLGSVPTAEAVVVSLLRRAGAIILGKTNMSEWANWRSLNSSNGWSARGGQAKGAYHPDQDPSGSSSGSGIAASIGLAAVSVGTETDGSIISPGAAGCTCSLKPTVGLTSRYMVIPISSTQDSVGPMAGDCLSAAHLLFAMAGRNLQDKATESIPFWKIPDYATSCRKGTLSGARLGVPTRFLKASSEGIETEMEAFEAAMDRLRTLGAKVDENVDFEKRDFQNGPFGGETAERIVLETEFKQGLKDYLSNLATNPNNINNLEELVRYTKTTSEEEYPDRDVAIWESAMKRGLTTKSPEYLKAIKEDKYLGGQGTILGALNNYNLDALILPTSQASTLAAMAGYPVITVPLGFHPPDAPIKYNTRGDLVDSGPNIPFGLSLIGRKFSEETLFKYACAWEKATQVRRKGPQPYLIPKANLIDFVE